VAVQIGNIFIEPSATMVAHDRCDDDRTAFEAEDVSPVSTRASLDTYSRL
jgi:hypothetical protein